MDRDNTFERQVNRVVITGPTGAIGMAIIEKCITKGIEMVLILNPNSKRNDRIPESPLIYSIECGVEEYENFDIKKKFAELGIENCSADAWIHLAWMGASGTGRDDAMLQLSNVKYMISAMEMAKEVNCETFIGAGSQAEYGPSNQKLGSDSPTRPVMGYGVAKLCAGQMGALRGKQLGMNFIWTRIFSVYGPYDGENTMVMSAIRNMSENKTSQYTKAEQQWDYLYSKDAANAILLLAQKGISGKVYCIGSGQTKQLRDYILAIKEIVDCKVEPEIGAVPYSANQVMYLCADISDLQQDTGFVPEYDFRQGVKETYDWYKMC